MQYRFGSVITEIPDLLRDESRYSFRDHRAQETLAVVVESPSTASTPTSLVEAKIARLSAVYGDDVSFEGVEALAASIGPAVIATASVDAVESATTHLAAVQAGPSAILSVEWTGSSPRRDMFRHVVGSISRSDDSPNVPRGFERRWAGRVSLDVPATYDSPRAFRFSSKSILIECFLEDSLRWAPPSGEQVAYLDRGRLEWVQADEPPDDELRGHPLHQGLWVFVRHDGGDAVVERYCVRQFVVGFADGTFYRVRGQTAGGDWARFTELWRGVLASTRMAGET